jgi:hypothetical protein
MKRRQQQQDRKIIKVQELPYLPRDVWKMVIFPLLQEWHCVSSMTVCKAWLQLFIETKTSIIAGGDNVKALTKTYLSQFKNLELLVLFQWDKTFNSIIPGIMNLRHLKTLSLVRDISQLKSDQLVKLTNLTALRFDCISNPPLDALGQLTGLRVLEIRNMQGLAIELGNALQHLTQLTYLNLSDTSCSPSILQYMPKLQLLRLPNHPINAIPFLVHCPALKFLSLGSFYKYPGDIDFSPMTNLKLLTLNMIFSDISTEIIIRMTTLRSLTTDRPFPCEVLQKMPNLDYLTLWHDAARMLRESNSNFDIVSDSTLATTYRRHGKMGSYETPFCEFTEWFSPLPSYFL